MDTGLGKTEQGLRLITTVWREWIDQVAALTPDEWVALPPDERQDLLAQHGGGPRIEIIVPLRSLEADWQLRIGRLAAPWLHIVAVDSYPPPASTDAWAASLGKSQALTAEC